MSNMVSITSAHTPEEFENGGFTAAWLAQLVERRTAVREVEGSSPRPDQHSGSSNNWGERAAFVIIWLDVQVFSDKDYKP